MEIGDKVEIPNSPYRPGKVVEIIEDMVCVDVPVYGPVWALRSDVKPKN